MPKTKRMLTGAEAIILAALWERPGQTMMEITRAVAPETAWSKHTVTTLLKRMTDKQTVRMDDSGPVRRYAPAIDREEVLRLETDDLLKRRFGGSPAALVRWMIGSGMLERSEAERILEDTKA